MKSRLFIFIATILVFGTQASAQMSCSEIFQAKPASLEYELGLLRDFKQIRGEIGKAKDLTEANDNIHLITVLSNVIMDHVVDIVKAVNMNKIASEHVDQYTQVSEKLIETLQRTFRIDNETMSEAIENKINFEFAEFQKEMQEQKQRRAIGFGRDQSSTRALKDQGTTRPIGFRTQKPIKDDNQNPAEKISIGFDLTDKTNLEKSIRDIVEYEETVESSPEPMGFVPFKQSSKDSGSEMRRPIGFVRFDPENNKITSDSLYKIIFDFEIGVFKLKKNTTGY